MSTWKHRLHSGDEVIYNGQVRKILVIEHKLKEKYATITWEDGTTEDVFYKDLS